LEDQTTCSAYMGGDNDAQYVLEVTAGFVAKNNITTESILDIISI